MIEHPCVFADDAGIWREDRPGRRFGIEWDDLYAVSVSKIDGIDEVYTQLQLDWPHGEFLEVGDECSGFEDVLDALAARIPVLASPLHSAVVRLGPGSTVEIWTRDTPGSVHEGGRSSR